MQSKTARHWAFTSFKDTIQPDETKLRYLVYQREVAPDTKKEHWQGYLSLNSPARMTGVKTIIGDPACHLEIAKGTAEQNKAYCTKLESRKEGTEPYEFGKISEQGQGAR